MTLAGPALCLTLVYEEPTEQEARAVETGPVALGIYHADGITALALRAGHLDDPDRVKASAPLILIDDEGHVVTALADAHARTAWPVHLTLCDTADGTVRVVQSVETPPELVASARQATRAQASRFASASEAAVEHTLRLRGLTTDHIFDRAEVRTVAPAARMSINVRPRLGQIRPHDESALR